MNLVKCEKCNRRMLEKTLKYKHQESCTGNTTKEPKTPKQPKTKDIKVEPVEDIKDINVEPPPIPPLKKSTIPCAMTVRQNKIKQKQEQYKSLVVHAF